MSDVTASPHIYLVAGEPSGDLLGAELMAALQSESVAGVRFSGVGGPEMTAQGLNSLFPMDDLSVMGLAEVLPKIPKLLGRISDVVRDVEAQSPDLLITIDAPDFSFRVAKRLHGKGIPLVHYVAPTVWAWRPGRAAKIARFLDHLLCLFPFEPAYFEKEGLSSTFVGHPVIAGDAVGADGAAFRKRHAIAPDVPLLCVLPGSRRGEVTRHLPIFRQTVEQLSENIPDLQVVSVTTGSVAEMVNNDISSWSIRTIVTNDPAEKYEAMAAATAALAASGTVTLELAVTGTPSVIAYQMNALTVWIGRRLVTSKYAGLVNILLGEEIMPERLIEACRPEILAPELLTLMRDEKARERQISAFARAIPMLASSPDLSPSQKAAQTVLGLIRDR